MLTALRTKLDPLLWNKPARNVAGGVANAQVPGTVFPYLKAELFTKY
jgi:hypothetical protein